MTVSGSCDEGSVQRAACESLSTTAHRSPGTPRVSDCIDACQDRILPIDQTVAEEWGRLNLPDPPGWFDPNYYDGDVLAPTKTSGHFLYEAAVEVTYKVEYAGWKIEDAARVWLNGEQVYRVNGDESGYDGFPVALDRIGTPARR